VSHEGLSLELATSGAAVGLIVGAGLRTVVFRYAVAAHHEQQTACPHCQRPLVASGVRALLPVVPTDGRCPGCHTRIGLPPATLEIATAVLLGALAARIGAHVDLLAFGWLGVVGVTLAAIDIVARRLPDRLTLPTYPVLITLLATAAAVRADAWLLLRALLGMAILAAFYLILVLLPRGGMGAGDLKLSGILGLALGWMGWNTLLTGTMVSFLLAGGFSVVLLVRGRATRHSTLPFGPFMIMGACLAILLAPLPS
jgi:leader peptidase (prepilin peptidase)/N-methyltransferase